MKNFTVYLTHGVRPLDSMEGRKRGKVLGHYKTYAGARRRAAKEISEWNKVHGYVAAVYDNTNGMVRITSREISRLESVGVK